MWRKLNERRGKQATEDASLWKMKEINQEDEGNETKAYIESADESRKLKNWSTE